MDFSNTVPSIMKKVSSKYLYSHFERQFRIRCESNLERHFGSEMTYTM